LSNLVNADWGEGSALAYDNARIDTLLTLARRERNTG